MVIAFLFFDTDFCVGLAYTVIIIGYLIAKQSK